MWLKIAVFIACSAGIIIVSLRSFRRKKSHGFYRFFGWEILLALIILNIDHWNQNPLIPRQVISWIFLTTSIYFAVTSFYLLMVLGAPSKEREDETLLGLEKTTRLVTVKIYRFIRHPMYSSLIFLAWGAFLKDVNWITLVLAMGATFFLITGALKEEKENLEYFGEDYRTYMDRTKRFVPFII